jgi:hypothetical protein
LNRAAVGAHRYIVSVSSHPARPAISRALRGGLALACVTFAVPSWAAVSIYVAPEELSRRSPWIVEGTVEASRSGFDPQNRTLATYVTLAVDTVHRGPAGLDRIVIREAGGRFGNLVHQTDGVPVYTRNERVLVFLEPARDGALRTSGMFFGKFVIEEDAEGRTRWAARDLGGQGTILHSPASAVERFALGDIVALASTRPRSRSSGFDTLADPGANEPGEPSFAKRAASSFAPTPPEYDRLLWDGGYQASVDSTTLSPTTRSATVDPLAVPGDPLATPAFRPLSTLGPSRWDSTDDGETVVVDIDRARDPLGDGAAAAAEVVRAMSAWNAVPESRFTFAPGDTDYDYTGSFQQSPAKLYTGRNVVLFDDPYNDISDPSGCSGVLAIGGYWRTDGTYSTVNGVDFRRSVQLYVIFNNDFECVLGVADDLAEIAAHELGHGIGIGHSIVDDAIMRSSPYRFRGPRLGDDDRDAAHCFYPHTLKIQTPNGGETLEAGRVYTVAWSSTAESGPDPGEVGLEYTLDGGQSWSTIAEGVPNDGAYDWSVPPTLGGPASVRVVRHSRTGLASAPFPKACSSDESDADFEIVPWSAKAGAVPSGTAEDGGLIVDKAYVDGWVVLKWGASCSTEATDYAIYEGDLAELRVGVWDHEPAACSTGAGLDETVWTGPGSRYFLVAPLAGTFEGHLGRGQDGVLRPPSPAACATRETGSVCE